MIVLGTLSPREQALVAVGVLLDGEDAAEYLSSDKERQAGLRPVAEELAKLAPELRISLVGSILRRGIEALEK